MGGDRGRSGSGSVKVLTGKTGNGLVDRLELGYYGFVAYMEDRSILSEIKGGPGGLRMKKTILKAAVPALVLTLTMTCGAHAAVIRGGAILASVSPLIKINTTVLGDAVLSEGDILYVFDETGEPVTRITVKDVFSDEIHSELIPESVAAQIRSTRAILVFSNLPEYGAFIRAHLDGSEEAFRGFVKGYPRSELRPEAERIIDGIIYRPFKLRGTIAAYGEFIDGHPENYYVKNAVRRRDTMIFRPFREADLLSSYRDFITTYPDNLFVPMAKERMKDLFATFEEVSVEHLARSPAELIGRRIRFVCRLHSVLPIYVEGTSVGKKAASFSSPRNSLEHLNFQVEAGDYVLWRLFASRDDTRLTSTLQLAGKGQTLMVYGTVFSLQGNAPWIDVIDAEVQE